MHSHWLLRGLVRTRGPPGCRPLVVGTGAPYSSPGEASAGPPRPWAGMYLVSFRASRVTGALIWASDTDRTLCTEQRSVWGVAFSGIAACCLGATGRGGCRLLRRRSAANGVAVPTRGQIRDIGLSVTSGSSLI
jgi:hypothetical protein